MACSHPAAGISLLLQSSSSSLLFSALNAATSFLVWLFLTNFQDRLNPHFGCRFSAGSPALLLSSSEDLLLDEGEDVSVEDVLLGEGSGGDGGNW